MNKKVRLLSLLFALVILLATSGWMYSLNQQQQLWGYLPLFQFGSLFASFILLVYPRFSKMKNKDQLMLAAIGSGVLLWASFPALPTTFLIFFAFIPLLWVEAKISAAHEGTARWEVFKYSYISFAIWNILTTYWVGNTALVAGVFAIFLSSAFMTIPFVLFHNTKKRLNEKLGYVAFIAYWISFEYIYLNQEISWTWLNIGNCFGQYPSWVQWYEYTGVFGGALWALVANVLGFQILKNYQQKHTVEKTSLLKMAAWILVPLLASVVIYTQHKNQGREVEVVVVQPNLEPHHVKFSLNRREQLQRFVSLSQKVLTDSTDYLVFPETSFNRVDYDHILRDRSIIPIKAMVDRYPGLKLITGISTQRELTADEPHGPAVRTYERGGKTRYFEMGNAAIQLTAKSDEVPIYIKSKLVPGAEFLPYREVFFFLKPLVEKLDGSMAGLAVQEERENLSGSLGEEIAPVICYESIYGAYATEYVQKGANALFIVTNDGWWDNTAGHRQHLAYARLRAIETRRSIARSANTGISGFINQRGDVLQATAYNEAIAIKGKIQLNNEMTVYTKWKDMIARILGFLSVLLLLNGFVKGRMRRK